MLRFLTVLTALFVAGHASAAEPKVAERWAVLVGVDDYANANDLQFCGADQTALRERLIASGFRAENVILLSDKATDNKYKPSQRNIEQQLRLVINSAEANDLLVVGFSGHGVSLAGKSYLCPNDATLSDPTTLVSLDGVYEQLRNCAARFKWVLVDACRNDPTLGGGRSFSATEGTKQLARSLQEIKLPEGVVLLNSCAPGEISWEEQAFAHGVYMHYVLEAMAGAGDADADGAVSLNELQRYASGRTKSYVIGKFNQTQRPFYRSEGEAEAMDFALLPIRGITTPIVPRSAPTPPTPNDAPPVNTITNSIGMKLALIPAGEFQMGSPAGDADAEDDEKPQHRVRITKPFYLGQTEVTQSQWQAVMGTSPWSGELYVREGADYPATHVSWDDAKEFCRKLSGREDKTYDLPTEAEWEYACRAGTTTKYSFGDDESRLGEYAWWGGINDDGNAMNEKYPHTVGTKRPNPWGLYDMHGNAWELCDDGYDAEHYGYSRADDPAGVTSRSIRVYRGGGWSGAPEHCRSANRSATQSNSRSNGLGFRVTLAPPVQIPLATPPATKMPGAKPGDVITNSIGMKLTLIPAGEFLMGAPEGDEDADKDEKPQHRVRITKPFYFGVHEVTQSQWQAVMGTAPWSDKEYVREGADYPAMCVSWDDTKEFCRKLSAREGKTYDLPTEAQWEYACRAGTTTKYSFGDDGARLNDYEWWGGIVGGGSAQDEHYAHVVGTKRPNSWGLYDMNGNLWEWCNDWFADDYYGESPVDDPSGLTSGSRRVTRGSSWQTLRVNSRPALRSSTPPYVQSAVVGFRVALVP